LVNCRFVRNSSSAIGNYGSSPRLTNCIFVANEVGMVNGVLHPNNPIPSRPDVVNCTFAASGIINSPESGSVVTNCILWGNIYPQNDTESSRIKGGTVVVNNSCIQGWSGELGGAGNLGLDPAFADPNGPDGKIGTLDDNLRLKPGSPCRDAGDNSALGADTLDLDGDGDLNEPIPFDIEGRPRIQNGRVDIGAYESDSPASGGRP